MKRQRQLLLPGVAILGVALIAGGSQAATLFNSSPFNVGAIGLSETTAGGDSQVSTDFPGGENPSLGLDGTTGTKFLMFDGEANDGDASDSGLIVFFPSPVTVQELRFGFANDGPERDPGSFTIEGSNSVDLAGTYNFNPILGGAPAALVDDDAEWTLIGGGRTGMSEPSDTFVDALASRFTFTDESPFNRSPDAITNNNAYSAYRILFPELRAPGNGIMQVGEIELLTVEEIPEPTSLMLVAIGLAGVATRRRG